MNNIDLIDIFLGVLAIGKSPHYSVTIDYDTEMNYVDIYLWYSKTEESIEIQDKLSNRLHSVKEITQTMAEWHRIVRKDREDYA